MDWPQTLAINAWTGSEAPSANLGAGAAGWGVQRRLRGAPRMLVAPEPVDQRDWAHPEVGWGLVLAENEACPEADRAVAADAPEPIRRLVAARRQAPVFRYRKGPQSHRFLRRYYTERGSQDIALSGSRRGTAAGCLPRYLLIYGTPREVPWSLQYVLNTVSRVGRLDLEGTGLEHYVEALLAGWTGAGCRSDQPVVWAVDHGDTDITWLMRHAIAEPVAQKLGADPDIGANLVKLAASEATAGRLTQALADRRPALVLTTSHGMTGPLNDAALMGQQLGLLVDGEHSRVAPDPLLAAWQPDGAIWYAHACCSAGSDDETSYEGLVEEGSSVERTLAAVAALGAGVAPLPQQLLGAERPLRAFIGHVEPTFDWTLRQPETGQVLTASLQEALYDRMFRKQPEPIGLALEGWYKHVGELFAQWSQALRQVAKAVPEASLVALRTQLAALDRQSLVILGDPTVALPPLATSG